MRKREDLTPTPLKPKSNNMKTEGANVLATLLSDPMTL